MVEWIAYQNPMKPFMFSGVRAAECMPACSLDVRAHASSLYTPTNLNPRDKRADAQGYLAIATGPPPPGGGGRRGGGGGQDGSAGYLQAEPNLMKDPCTTNRRSDRPAPVFMAG